MKKRVAKFLVLCGVLAAGAAALNYFTREPSLDGRSLSEWLRLEREQHFRRDNTDVTNAVRAIGVKGIPILLDKMRTREPAWRSWLDNEWGRKIFSDRWINAANYQHKEARYGFSILGTQAVMALPELSKMLYDVDIANVVGDAVGSIGPEALPVLRQALTNDDLTIRHAAILGITARRDIALLAMPEIMALRQDTNAWVPMTALDRIPASLPKAESWPVAVEFLGDSRPQVQVMALWILASATTNAATAVPLVVPFLTNADINLRGGATGVIVALDPVAAAAYGVNTNLYWPSGVLK